MLKDFPAACSSGEKNRMNCFCTDNEAIHVPSVAMATKLSLLFELHLKVKYTKFEFYTILHLGVKKHYITLLHFGHL